MISNFQVFVNNFFKFFIKQGYKDSNLEMTESESVALPFGDSPIWSAGGGIRTHAPLRTNGFQDRLVMTTSIPLHESGWWESNPRIQLGRLVFYHWTTPAYLIVHKSGWQDSNLRPPGPKPGALAKLSHTPIQFFICTFKTSCRFPNCKHLITLKTFHFRKSRSSRFRFASSRWFCYAKLRLYQVSSPQANLFHATFYILPSFSAFGQALDRLVTVSSMCCHTSTSALSTL